MEIPRPEKLIKKGIDYYPFQKETILKMVNSPSPKVINASEMGLGKTIEALGWANMLGLSRLLITCTASARLNWAREADTWFTLRKKNQFSKAILSSKDLREVLKDTLIKKSQYQPSPLIVSYDMLVSSKPLRDYIASRTWDGLISDEFQECKSMSAQRTVAAMFLWQHIPHCAFLSGTPITNSAADLFPTLNAITQQPDLKPLFTKEQRNNCETFDNFTQKFTYIYNGNYGTQYTGIRNRDALKALLHNPKSSHYFRVLKKDVMKDLPDKTFNRVDLNLNVETSLDPKFLARFLKYFENNQNEDIERAGNTKQMGTLRRELGEAIVHSKDAHEFTRSFLNYGKPLVLFAWHKSVIAELKQQFKRFNPVTLDGSTSPKDKQRAIDTFQAGDTLLFIGQIKAAGTAITLTRAADCIFYEIDWLPYIIAQAIDRLHRIGQKNAVTAHFLVTKNEFHKHFIQTMIRKQRSIDKVI